MEDSRSVFVRFITIAALAVVPFSSHAETLTGFVTAITDGDTLSLQVDKKQYKIRIATIDAPEKAQTFGAKSKANLGQLAFNKDALANCPKTGFYGRLICKVTVDGLDVVRQQVKDGIAWWY